MDIKIIQSLFFFIGGIGMFLYGMTIMGEGLQNSAKNKMKEWLARLTKNKFTAVIMGMLITAIIQSSSATTIMVVGFVNASMINLNQAVGIIMGANVGTTITAWIVSMGEWSQALKPEFIAPLLIGVGAFVMLLAKSNKSKNFSKILIGFGLLFVGLTFMSDVIGEYSDLPIFKNAFIVLGKNPILAIMVGLVVTGIIQSSSASVGILQTLATNGLVSFSSAIFITLGQNIGTCITAMLSSIGANKTAKQAAFIHFLFNTLGAVIFAILATIVFYFNPILANTNISSVQISIFHTIFNIGSTLILIPFSNLLVRISQKVISDKEEKVKEEGHILLHLDDRLLENPFFAIESANREVLELAKLVTNNVDISTKSLLNKDKELIKQVFENEKTINWLTEKIGDYLVKINGLNLNDSQSQRLTNIFNIINDLERVGDHGDNLAELALYAIDENLNFSNDAYLELKAMINNCLLGLKFTEEIIETNDLTLVKKISDLEHEVDFQEKTFKLNHLQRLTDGLCDSKVGIIFIEVLVNLERISDHTLNIANYM